MTNSAGLDFSKLSRTSPADMMVILESFSNSLKAPSLCIQDLDNRHQEIEANHRDLLKRIQHAVQRKLDTMNVATEVLKRTAQWSIFAIPVSFWVCIESGNRPYVGLNFFLTTVLIIGLIVKTYLRDSIKEEATNLFKEELEGRYLQEINWIRSCSKQVKKQIAQASDPQEVAALTALSTYFEQVLAFHNRKPQTRDISATCPSCNHFFSIPVSS